MELLAVREEQVFLDVVLFGCVLKDFRRNMKIFFFFSVLYFQNDLSHDYR